jgi:hypothetical protein
MMQSDSFDPEALRLAGDGREALLQNPPKRLPRHRPGEAFLKGPVPWSWLTTAARLPGKALHMGVLLWQEAGCRKSRAVRLCLSFGAKVGVPLTSARRALRRLEAAGLVSVEYLPGQALRVTLLEPPAGMEATS